MKLISISKQRAIIAPLAGLLLAAPAAQAADESTANSLTDAFSNGTVKVQFRYRYENVDQDNSLENADASTLKSRISFQTQEYRDFTAFVEVDDISNIGNDNHNTTRNGMTDHSVVADPEGTEFNQAWLQYSGIADTLVRYGRQRVNLDNQRFIGGVGWRQNEQTYDGVTLTNTSLTNTKITYLYADNVNRIFGPDSGTPDEDLDSDIHAFNISHNLPSLGKISAYAYLLDVDDAEAFSSNTYGVRLDGKHKVDDDLTLLYTAEYATQEDASDNPASYRADYWVAEAGAKYQAVTAKISMEVLEGDENKAGESFRTPFATLHGFQGWADQFLNTPDAGIEDMYVTLKTKAFGATWTAVYHDFEAEDGGADYGEELDIAISKKLTKNVNALIKYANYDADEHGVDVEKLWFQLQVNF